MKTPTNLQFWVDKLKKGEKFSMARWGDGELYCMWGKKGQNSNGCRYSPELRQSLLDSMKPREGFYHGLQRVLPRDEERIMKEYPEINWYETECLSEAVANGELYPLIEQLNLTEDLHMIGNESIQWKTAELIDWDDFCTVPPSNAFDLREIVMQCVRNTGSKGVYLFSCGMAANAFISELHGTVDGSLIDLGHIWDPFTGLMSRCDLEGKTLEDINKNLHETN
jgi:hypothetical protein